MINQQLLDYMRQQLTVGVAREIIKVNLMSRGWLEQDITEGFITIEKTTMAPIPQVPIAFSVEQVVPTQSAKILNEKVPITSSTTQVGMWAKGIPRTNKVFMVISLVLVFGLDLVILLSSGFSLFEFWAMMLVVLAIFAVFFYIENFVFRKRFSGTISSLDKWISVIIVVRNIVFVLNFIPFIQMLGWATLIFGGIPYLIIYSILLSKRRSVSQAS